MTTRKTMFSSDATLDDMLASSNTPSESKSTADFSILEGKVGQGKSFSQKVLAIEKVSKQTKRKPKPSIKSIQVDSIHVQQLNVEIDNTLIAAINMRKGIAKANGTDAEKTLTGIVSIALKKHLSQEVAFVESTMAARDW